MDSDTLTGAAHELCVHGNRVVWLEGLNPEVRTVKKVYSVETDILQALWCRFTAKKLQSGSVRGDGDGRKEKDDGSSSKEGEDGLLCICVREHNCLTLFLQTGAIHYVPLPFMVRSHTHIYT